MTRDELVKALRHCSKMGAPCETCPIYGYDPNCFLHIREIVANMLEQDAPGWISVKDRLPEDSERVLAYFPEMRDSEADIQLSKGWAINKFVSYWMPMPEPPKEDKK